MLICAHRKRDDLNRKILNYKRTYSPKTIAVGGDVEAEVVKFLWKRKHFEERSWKQTRKHLIF